MKYSNEQVTISRLMSHITNGELNVDTPYQRGDVWDRQRREDLIYSILSGYPIGEMEWDARNADEENDAYDCVEGKQRTLTIKRFINDEFTLSNNFPPIGEDEVDLSGKRFSELDDKYKNKILSTQVSVVMVLSGTDEEVTSHFYYRNNGKPLTRAELLNVRGVSRAAFAEIAQEGIIQELNSSKGIAGHKDAETAQKAYAMLFMENTDYSAKVFKNYCMNVEVTNENKAHLIQCLDYVAEFYNSLDPENEQEAEVRRMMKRVIHFTSAVYLADICINNDVESADYYVLALNFFNNIPADYTDTTRQGTAKAPVIEARKQAIMRYYERNHK